MQEFSISGPKREFSIEALKKSPMFGKLSEADLDLVLTHCQWVEFAPHEPIVQEGEAAEHFFLLLEGYAEITVSHTTLDDQIEVGHISPVSVFGEMALLLNHPRTANVSAREPTTVLRFGKDAFAMMMEGIKGWARQLSVSLATRLAQTSRRVPLPLLTLEEIGEIDPNTIRSLPSPFVFRHRVLPLSFSEGVMRLGFVDDPTPQIVNAVRRMLPSIHIRPFRIGLEIFDDVLKAHGFSDAFQLGSDEPSKEGEPPVVVGVVAAEEPDEIKPLSSEEAKQRLSKIAPLLQRMVAEGASDLHMCAGQKPRWRIDGDLYAIEDCRPLHAQEAEELLSGMMPISCRKELREELQTDFSYSMEGIGRFRVNMYYDDKGCAAVLRHIPSVIPSIEQLQLPKALRKMIEMKQGLVLITGPTGSGKSTTLAALIEAINQEHPKHIITLEDPIEFVYESKKSLINQRQIGLHAKSFNMGLRGALREDPDIVLVGELRDVETMMLAIETANTGHLVLGTLHTRGAISTIERIVDMFPAELQGQIRHSLSDLLRCVVSQVLCKRKGGGRVAGFELLMINQAAANLIRQNKTHQINTVLTTQQPNQALNAHLETLVKKGVIEAKDALDATSERDDLVQRLGRFASHVNMYMSSKTSSTSGQKPMKSSPGMRLPSTPKKK